MSDPVRRSRRDQTQAPDLSSKFPESRSLFHFLACFQQCWNLQPNGAPLVCGDILWRHGWCLTGMAWHEITWKFPNYCSNLKQNCQIIVCKFSCIVSSPVVYFWKAEIYSWFASVRRARRSKISSFVLDLWTRSRSCSLYHISYCFFSLSWKFVRGLGMNTYFPLIPLHPIWSSHPVSSFLIWSFIRLPACFPACSPACLLTSSFASQSRHSVSQLFSIF